MYNLQPGGKLSKADQVDICDLLGAVLATGISARDGVSAVGEIDFSAEVAFLFGQLNAAVNEIQGLIADVESGCSVHELGLDGEDLESLIQSLCSEIANLSARVRGVLARCQELRRSNHR